MLHIQAKDKLEGRFVKLQQRHDELWSHHKHVRQHHDQISQSLEKDGWPDSKKANKVSLLTMNTQLTHQD